MVVSVFVDKNKLGLAEAEALSDKAVCKTRQIASISAHYATRRDRGTRGTRGTVTACLLYIYYVCTDTQTNPKGKYKLAPLYKAYIS